MSEFSLIERYFAHLSSVDKNIPVGIGDDAAIAEVSKLKRLAISVDAFIEDVHFPKKTHPYDIGWKSLAINLSDMAAMAAKPLWVTLAITLPEQDESWISEFCRGFTDIAHRFDVTLIGGDTTRGPCSITVNIFGDVGESCGTLRSGAKPGDKIYVSGFLGDAALGLQSLSRYLPLSNSEQHMLRTKLNRPMPRVKDALLLKPFVNSAIDISDGLHADLQHILTASGVGAVVHVNQLPISREYQWCCNGTQRYDLALTAGDDYELCVTVSEENEQKFLATAAQYETRWSHIGEITLDRGLQYLNADAEQYSVIANAYDHFR